MNKILIRIKEQVRGLIERGALHIFLGNFVTKFVAFFGSIFIVRLLSKADYGTLGYMENLFHYVYLFAGLGLTNALFRYVILADNIIKKRTFYDYVIQKSTMLNLALVIVSCVIAVCYPHPEQFQQATWLLPILLLSIPLNSLVDSHTGMLRAMFNNKAYALASCLTIVLVVGLKYALSVIWGLNGAVFAALLAYGAMTLILTVYIHKCYFSEVPKEPLKDPKEKKAVFGYSIQYMITNGIWALFMLNDVFLLGQLLGDSAMVADYKVAYVLPGNLSLISSSIGVFVSPYFVKHENDVHWIKRHYKKTFLVTMGIVGLAVVAVYILAGPLITLLYGRQYLNVVPVMRILLIASFINNGLRYTNANLLSAMGQVKYNMFVSITGLVVQVTVNLFVIPRHGMMGIAYTSVGVYALMAMFLFGIFYVKYFRREKSISGQKN